MAAFRNALPLPLALCLVSYPAAAAAQTKADSGWTPVFNGRNLDGLYIRSGRAILRDPDKQDHTRINADGSLYIANPGPAGAICTKANHSYYHARLKYRFASASGTPNAGGLYHVDSLDYVEGYAYGSNTVDRVPSLQPSCGGSWFPKGFEIQMRRGQTGAVYGVANVWGETNARDGRWDPAGDPRSILPSQSSGPKNLNPSKGDWPDGPDEWVSMEFYVYGADSVIHVVNGMRVFKMTNLRHNRLMVPCGTGGGNWGAGEKLPLTNGKMCVQIESANITYRDWEMRPLPKDGKPVTAARIEAGRGEASLSARRISGGFVFRAEDPAGSRTALRLEIVDMFGKTLRSFDLQGGSGTVTWDGAGASGARAAPGLYLARLQTPSGLTAVRVILD